MALVLPESAFQTLEPLSMFLVTVVYSLLILGFSLLMYKTLPKNFFKITKGKVIATAIIFIIPLISQIQLFLSTSLNIIKIFTVFLGLTINVISLFLLISSVIFLYYQIKEKRIPKEKKETTLSIIMILILNGWTLRLVLFFLMVFANIYLFN